MLTLGLPQGQVSDMGPDCVGSVSAVRTPASGQPVAGAHSRERVGAQRCGGRCLPGMREARLWRALLDLQCSAEPWQRTLPVLPTASSRGKLVCSHSTLCLSWDRV